MKLMLRLMKILQRAGLFTDAQLGEKRKPWSKGAASWQHAAEV